MSILATGEMSQRKAAQIAGIAILIMAICAAFAFGAIHNSLVIKGDAAATLTNISESISLFRGEILLWLIILICDIVVSWALYIYLKQVNSGLSLLGALFRFTYSAVLGIAISNLIFASLLASGGSDLAAAQVDHAKAQLMLYIDAFSRTWSLGLVIFGLHLFVVGYLVLKSNSIPKFLGILLLIASFSYAVIHLSHLFLPQYEKTTALVESILSLPMTVGELGFGIWLLIKGGKTSRIKS